MIPLKGLSCDCCGKELKHGMLWPFGEPVPLCSDCFWKNLRWRDWENRHCTGLAPTDFTARQLGIPWPRIDRVWPRYRYKDDEEEEWEE